MKIRKNHLLFNIMLFFYLVATPTINSGNISYKDWNMKDQFFTYFPVVTLLVHLFLEVGTSFATKKSIPARVKKMREELVASIHSNEPITLNGKKYKCYTNKNFEALEQMVHAVLKSEGLENVEELLILGIKDSYTNVYSLLKTTQICHGITYCFCFRPTNILSRLLFSPVRIPIAIMLRESSLKNPSVILHEIGHVLCSQDTRFSNYRKKVNNLEEIVADLYALYSLCEIDQNSSESVQESVLNLIQEDIKKEPYLNHKEWYEYGKEYFARLQQNQNKIMVLSKKLDMLVTDAKKIIKKRRREKRRK